MNAAKKTFNHFTFLLVIVSFYCVTVFTFAHTQQTHKQELTTTESTTTFQGFSESDFLEDIQMTKKELTINCIFNCQTNIGFDKHLYIPSQLSASIWQPPRLN